MEIFILGLIKASHLYHKKADFLMKSALFVYFASVSPAWLRLKKKFGVLFHNQHRNFRMLNNVVTNASQKDTFYVSLTSAANDNHYRPIYFGIGAYFLSRIVFIISDQNFSNDVQIVLFYAFFRL